MSTLQSVCGPNGCSSLLLLLLVNMSSRGGYYVEHPSGYHGHYQKESKQLVDPTVIEDLSKNDNNPIFHKYYEATKKLEQTLISSKDFVNHHENESGEISCTLSIFSHEYT